MAIGTQGNTKTFNIFIEIDRQMGLTPLAKMILGWSMISFGARCPNLINPVLINMID